MNSFNLFKIISEGLTTLDKATIFPLGCFFSQFNFFIYFQFNQWDHVLNWKYKQELELRDKKKDLGLKKYLREFIQYYEKVSKWMHLKVPKYCNILIKLDAHQKIKSINLR